MAIYEVIQHPDERLRRKAKRVEVFDETVLSIVANMWETKRSLKNCAALAATQLSIEDPPYITVIDFSENQDSPLCLVNARLTNPEGETLEKEGCMSVKNIYKAVTRAASIQVDAQDEHGAPVSFRATGFMAKCVQHEMDHLEGKIYIDYLTAFQRKLILEKLRKRQK